MYNLWSSYFSILVYIIISLIISVLVLTISYLLASQESYNEKLSAYECGFSPFDEARNKFDVKFYLVAILFIIFDLEVSFLFPWVTMLRDLGDLAFWSMFLFLVILTVGFIYEWMKGALEWN